MSIFLDEQIKNRNLPELLKLHSGKHVNSIKDWEVRRQEIIALLENTCYGKTPDVNCEVSADVIMEDDNAVCGKAMLKRVMISITMDYLAGGFPSFSHKYTHPYVWGDKIKSREVLSFPINIIVPKMKNKAPMFLYASFSPVVETDNVPIEEIVDQGYGIASFYYQDVTADRKDEYPRGNALYPDSSNKTEWGALSKWAWAFSRVMDYIQKVEGVDSEKIAVCGASRLGKAALWSGANDGRFSLVVPMISGTGGASFYRENKREDINHLIRCFPYWFCRNYLEYKSDEKNLPYDSHFLLSLVAPRNLYLFSGEEDSCVDYEGEYLAAYSASAAYRIYSKKGFVAEDNFPEPGQKFHEGEIGYHLRSGPHCVSRYDWNSLIQYRNIHNV